MKPKPVFVIAAFIIAGLSFLMARVSALVETKPRDVFILACDDSVCSGFTVYDFAYVTRLKDLSDHAAQSIHANSQYADFELGGSGVWKLTMTGACRYSLIGRDREGISKQTVEKYEQWCQRGEPVEVIEIADRYDFQVFDRERELWKWKAFFLVPITERPLLFGIVGANLLLLATIGLAFRKGHIKAGRFMFGLTMLAKIVLGYYLLLALIFTGGSRAHIYVIAFFVIAELVGLIGYLVWRQL